MKRSIVNSVIHIVFLLLALCLTVGGFAPGISGKSFKEGEAVDIKYNALTSVDVPLSYTIYYLDVCRPRRIIKNVDSFGEMLFGDQPENSPYLINMKNSTTCRLLCRKTLSDFERSKFIEMIDQGYTVNLIADGIPAVTPYLSDENSTEVLYAAGFPLGRKEAKASEIGGYHYYLNNYLSFKFWINPELIDESSFLGSNETFNLSYSVVGFEVTPMSFREDSSTTSSLKADCSTIGHRKGLAPLTSKSWLARENAFIEPELWLDIEASSNITFIYDIEFKEVELDYFKRYNAYLNSQRLGIPTHDKARWFSIVNSLIVVLILGVVVAMILLRTLKNDIYRYNELVMSPEHQAEDSGWKLLHGDVFRKPKHSTFLAALVGSGVQVLVMVYVTLIIATLGVYMHPAKGFSRGRLLQAALLLWSFAGVVGGYTAARFYKLFQSPNWKLTTVRTAVVYPAAVLSVVLFMNIILSLMGSDKTPFGTILIVFLLWIGISTPLVFLGAYYGFKRPAITIPVRVNKIPRAIPTQPWLMHPLVICLTGGAFSFGAVFTEMMFVMSSIWHQQVFVLFGFLVMVAVILTITAAEITITLVYFQLITENHNWWWRSFIICGSSGLYVFAFLIYCLFSRLSWANFSNVLLFFGYSTIVSFTFFILTGTIGFMASFLFVLKIYGSIRID